jgi:hypothetical protein
MRGANHGEVPIMERCQTLGVVVIWILRNRPDVVATWSDEEVATRWLKVFPGRRIEEQLAAPTQSDVKALVNDAKRMQEIRQRLSDISWFMRALAEPIARMANRQDDCTGRFWEGRFKAQRIVDEAGLLACSMYVDLNPIRAALAQSIEQATHTSAHDRLQGHRGQEIDSAAFDLAVLSNQEAGDFHKHKTVDEQRQELRQRGRHVDRSSGRRVRRDGWLAPLTLAKDVLSNDPLAHKTVYVPAIEASCESNGKIIFDFCVGRPRKRATIPMARTTKSRTRCCNRSGSMATCGVTWCGTSRSTLARAVVRGSPRPCRSTPTRMASVGTEASDTCKQIRS